MLDSTGELQCAGYQICCNRLCLSAQVQHSLRGEVFKGSLSSVQIQNVRINCQPLNNNLGDCHGALQRNHRCWIAVTKRLHQSHSIGRLAKVLQRLHLCSALTKLPMRLPPDEAPLKIELSLFMALPKALAVQQQSQSVQQHSIRMFVPTRAVKQKSLQSALTPER